MTTNLAPPVVRHNRHTTTIDIAVIGTIIHLAAGEVEGLHEAQLLRAEPVIEGKVEDSDSPRSKDKEPPPSKFDEHADLVLHIKVVPYMNQPIRPLTVALRNRVIERIQAVTELRIHAVHIHIAGLWLR